MSKRDIFLTIQAACPQLKLRENEPLSNHTSFRIGGPAACMAFPKSCEELADLLRAAEAYQIPFRLLGAGTNVLAPDEGMEELIVCTKDALLGLRALEENRIQAMAGESLAKTAVFARTYGLSGLEFAHGIPGTVGGGVYMNAGAYGGELCQVCESVTAMRLDGTLVTMSGESLCFGYRASVFEQGGLIVVSAIFRLKPAEPETIQQTMRELMGRRVASQPLELPSAGSTFKRPQGAFAGALIEQAGLKGKGVGGAQVSQKHAGFVVNVGGATAADVCGTIELVQKTVREQSGFALEPEVRIW